MYQDYPLAPEKLAITYDILSDYCEKIAYKYGIKVDDVIKLIPNFGDKTNYLFHYRNLQLHLSLGMKLTKIHKALKFKQSDWMKFILILTPKKLKNAANSFEKNFLNWWLTLSMAKQWKIYENESVLA